MSEPVRRTLEIEEWTNRYFVHPISGFLVPRFAALRISPNAVSVAGMACGIAAGVAYARYQDPVCLFLGFILMVAWHVLDGADGQLARLTNAQSELGKVLDGLCDHVIFIAVYAGLATALSRQFGDYVWLLVAIAGVCHAVQSAIYETQRQEYGIWGLGRKPGRAPEARSWVDRAAGGLDRIYTMVQRFAADDMSADQARMASILAAQPARADAVRRRYRESFAPLVRQWAVMSANYRTLGIFACALIGRPVIYFWVEIVGFSAISLLLLHQRRTRYALMFDGLEPAAPSRTRLAVGSVEEVNG